MSAFTFPTIHPTAKVSAALIAAGHRVISYSELDREVDGAVYLSTRVHVQVGLTYFNVVEEHADHTFTFYPERRSLEMLLRDLRRALTKEAPQ